MGLDINLLGKPTAGDYAEFEAVWRALTDDSKGIAVTTGPFIKVRPASLSGLINEKRTFDRDAALNRFQQISIPAYKSLNAPVVGQDEAADNWVRIAFDQGRFKHPTFEAALSDLSGYLALEAMPESDAFPVYTNAYLYQGVDRTSFRGSFLEACTDVIGKDQLSLAWEPMLCADFAEWGKGLRIAADDFAAKHGFEAILGMRDLRPAEADATQKKTKATTSHDQQLHIVDQAARWVFFWADKGHGSDPYY
jgi:hypothetical protein